MKNRLCLNKEIYCIDNIKQAIVDYQKIASIDVCEDEKHFYCDFKETLYDVDLTINEFENYVIGSMFK